MKNSILIGMALFSGVTLASPLPYSLSGQAPTSNLTTPSTENTKNFKMDFSGINEALIKGLKRNTKQGNNNLIDEIKQNSVVEKKTVANRLKPDSFNNDTKNKQQLKKKRVSNMPSKKDSFCKRFIANTPQDQITGAVVKEVSGGGNILIPISASFLNKVETPFKNVAALSSSKAMSTLRKGVNKNILMISSKDKKSASSMFLQDVHGNTANVTFVPCGIPPQNITLTFSKEMKGGGDVNAFKPRKKAKKWEQNSDFSAKVSEIMALTAKGDVPEGYDYQEIDKAPTGIVCKTQGLYGKLHQVLEGSNMRMAIYLAKNRSDRIINIKEKNCYTENVIAVSAYPNVKLAPGEFTEMFILLNKNIRKVKKNTRKIFIR
jgi:hypothetical protein